MDTRIGYLKNVAHVNVRCYDVKATKTNKSKGTTARVSKRQEVKEHWITPAVLMINKAVAQ